MTGAITDIGSLERWFKQNNRPFWSVKYQGPNERVIARNDSVTDVSQAWDNLEAIIKMQTESGRAVLEVLQYGSEKGAQGHALRTNVDIRDYGGPRYPVQQAPAVAGYPGVGNIEDLIEQRVHLAMLERENEDLKAAINAPGSMLERVVDKIAESPHLSQVVAQLVAGLFNRAGAPMPMPVPVNGVTPQPAHSTSTDADDDADLSEEDRVFWENIQSVAHTLGVDLPTLAVKLNNLVQQNPALAKSLIA
jgi:hypothetical protein